MIIVNVFLKGKDITQGGNIWVKWQFKLGSEIKFASPDIPYHVTSSHLKAQNRVISIAFHWYPKLVVFDCYSQSLWGGGHFLTLRGGVQTKNFGEENRHFESWRGDKNRPPGQNIHPCSIQNTSVNWTVTVTVITFMLAQTDSIYNSTIKEFLSRYYQKSDLPEWKQNYFTVLLK